MLPDGWGDGDGVGVGVGDGGGGGGVGVGVGVGDGGGGGGVGDGGGCRFGLTVTGMPSVGEQISAPGCPRAWVVPTFIKNVPFAAWGDEAPKIVSTLTVVVKVFEIAVQMVAKLLES